MSEVLVIDNVDSTVIGGGCHPDKCKHRILLEKNTMFTVLSASDSDKYHLDKCLRKGVYKYRSYLLQDFSFAACAGTVTVVAFFANEFVVIYRRASDFAAACFSYWVT